jgi:hypothetical protein
VWNCLASSRVTIAKQIATKLAMLHENRIAADYRLNYVQAGNIAFARDNVERAKYIQQLLVTCRNEPAQSQIRAGIEAHRKP